MHFFRILFLIFFSTPFCFAQQAPQPAAPPFQLPAMSIITENAQNELKWMNQFDGVKSIAVQRSTDSVINFVTIGVINAPKKGPGSYRDERPVAGKNYYRLSIGFSGDMEWYSNVYKVKMDSALIAQSHIGAIEAGSTNSKTGGATANTSNATDFYYTPSLRIYTNPYTGHITISLVDALAKRYSIRFYDPENKEVLRISRVSKTTLILDKNNFNSRGTYNFKLYEGVTLVETGYVTIY